MPASIRRVSQPPVKVSSEPEIYCVSVPFGNRYAKPTNCYMVKDRGDALVIDPGASSEVAYRTVVDALNELEIDPHDATFLITHAHSDHAGVVDRLVPSDATLVLGARNEACVAEDFPSWARARYAEVLSGEGAPEKDLAILDDFLRANFGIPHHRRRRFVCDGDAVQVGRWAFEVKETPGHAKGHIALYEPNTRTLISGDSILFYVSPSIDLALEGDDVLSEYCETLARIKALDPAQVLVGHCHAEGSAAQRAGGLLAHNGKRLARFEDQVRREPGLTGYRIVREQYCPDERIWERMRFTRKIAILSKGKALLDRLVRIGAINRDENDEGVGVYRV